jgi:hypothetical protein
MLQLPPKRKVAASAACCENTYPRFQNLTYIPCRRSSRGTGRPPELFGKSGRRRAKSPGDFSTRRSPEGSTRGASPCGMLLSLGRQPSQEGWPRRVDESGFVTAARGVLLLLLLQFAVRLSFAKPDGTRCREAPRSLSSSGGDRFFDSSGRKVARAMLRVSAPP